MTEPHDPLDDMSPQTLEASSVQPGEPQDLEEKLRRARAHIDCCEERFRLLFDQSRDAMMTLAPPSWKYTSGNERIMELFGVRSLEAFLKLEPWHVSPVTQPDGRTSEEKALEMIEKAMNDGSHFFEWTHQRVDGEPFPATVLLQRLGCEHHSFLLATVRDISEPVRARQALRESERMFATLVDNLPGFVYRCRNDAAWTAEFLSSGCLHVTGYPAEDFVRDRRRSLGDLILPTWRERVWTQCQEALARREQLQVEYPIRTASGEERWVWERGQGVFDADGTLLFLEGFVTDITERHRAQQERERLQAQLAHAQKLESIGRLAGGVAHDFNNMLGVILGHVELIRQRADLPGELQEDLADIQTAARRSADLTRQLLAFARRQTVTPVRLDLNGTIEGLVKMLARLIGENITLDWRPGPSVRPVRIDPSQIDQLLTNLCVNARDAISGVGTIAITTGEVLLDDAGCAGDPGCRPGPYTVLTVSDTGCGMDEAVLSQVFEPFFTSKAVGEGTGLGLSIVHGIVRQNGGFVQVESAPGAGAVFRVHLPVDLSDRVVPPAQEPSAAPGGGHETLLLVEDEPAVLKFTARVLSGAGYEVLAASTPGEALRIARVHPGPLQGMITDVLMPEMDGRTLAGKVRGLHPGIRCLFMSGYAEELITNQGILDGGVRFLQKPFTVAGLLAKVREALDAG
ncbi:MAG: hypothetical protein CVU59_10985 [Deltaproteobacteria bacterium HGW-Deltaproteobacteria-17]|nr:MAG: hypothetical protein CVU59_10985 [Deltaproteobacteria bacterium HGW-Deltaproteobacteria-17]